MARPVARRPWVCARHSSVSLSTSSYRLVFISMICTNPAMAPPFSRAMRAARARYRKNFRRSPRQLRRHELASLVAGSADEDLPQGDRRRRRTGAGRRVLLAGLDQPLERRELVDEDGQALTARPRDRLGADGGNVGGYRPLHGLGEHVDGVEGPMAAAVLEGPVLARTKHDLVRVLES